MIHRKSCIKNEQIFNQSKVSGSKCWVKKKKNKTQPDTWIINFASICSRVYFVYLQLKTEKFLRKIIINKWTKYHAGRKKWMKSIWKAWIIYVTLYKKKGKEENDDDDNGIMCFSILYYDVFLLFSYRRSRRTARLQVYSKDNTVRHEMASYYKSLCLFMRMSLEFLLTIKFVLASFVRVFFCVLDRMGKCLFTFQEKHGKVIFFIFSWNKKKGF